MVRKGTLSTIGANLNSRVPTGKAFSGTGSLFIEKMLANPNYKTLISLPGSLGYVTGFCEGPFAFEGSAEWTAIGEAVNKKLDEIAAGVQALNRLSRGAISAGTENGRDLITDRSIKSLGSTEVRWVGSGSPVFNLKFIMPSYNAQSTQSPTDMVKLLMMCVYPSKDKGSELILKAPLDYGVEVRGKGESNVPYGTVTVSRGKFFKAPHQVVTSVATAFSQEIMTDGRPLYIEVNITFKPWRTQTYSEVMNYFRL